MPPSTNFLNSPLFRPKSTSPCSEAQIVPSVSVPRLNAPDVTGCQLDKLPTPWTVQIFIPGVAKDPLISFRGVPMDREFQPMGHLTCLFRKASWKEAETTPAVLADGWRANPFARRQPMRITSLLAAATIALAAPVPEPPGVPSTSTAQSDLSSLQVAASGSGDGYSRAEFPHWVKVESSCDAREYVLKRDGQGVEADSTCKITAGTWFSPYDGTTWTNSSLVDIDHMVPLQNAWILLTCIRKKSGAASWTKAQRQDFANDIKRPQLYAVSAKANRSKGDRSPDGWKPPLTSFYCTYAKSWVAVKSYYKLTITSAEKSALSDMLDTC
ncbi:hypothetical protein CCM_03847 [Cordyceps militaris CM01]|uniref:GmrSD restriction endonucleases C-terminal domain-containing protein n=1 Tax=Cordyceps militaris (strain CM01) TaxID=983644 RepID=G3JCU6_CORMM|nr:uncharacterized protein CCM_03847 [Cordyceps militaris CM01]EGX92474.1 hypothetical protein CCM_03847 [Cordyceps militaris CM01]